jgi:hypothetical protein
MEAKEKAKQLRDKYFALVSMTHAEWDLSKQCALIAVDEIIMEREVIYASLGIPSGQFWKDVKREIESL